MPPPFGRAVRYLLVLFLLSSCGYHVGQGELQSRYSTLTIPIVEGDETGFFTQELIYAISSSGSFHYVPSDGQGCLKVTILRYDQKNVGFRWDRNTDNEILKSTIPAEERLTAIAEVTLFDSCTGSVITGPDRIRASVDFDHEYTTSRQSVNQFSLGQVTDVDEARDAARTPLNRVLAHKIVDYLSNIW